MVLATCVLMALSFLPSCAGGPERDLVTSLPGFENSSWPFKVYSGLLDVPGPINGYDSLKIHYQFHTSQWSPSNDPVVVWHQGGPDGTSMYGLYGEVGAFQIGAAANYINPWAWNRVANMLYLESPAGSGHSKGYSVCMKLTKPVTCEWDDMSQGEAYAHTLQAFFQSFPEFQGRALFLAGESYFGIYGPIIANYVLNHEPFRSSLNLKGLALGNAAWGGNHTCIAVNGPSEDKVDVDFYFGRGLFSPKLKEAIDSVCSFPVAYTDCSDPAADYPAGHQVLSTKCKTLLTEMRRQVGPHNIYFVYDNCPATQELLKRTGKDMQWLSSFLRRGMHDPAGTSEALAKLNGGYRWDCGGDESDWISRPDVRKALHLEAYQPGASGFHYKLSGPAAATLYPELLKEIKLLVFSGDADACVPYIGTQSWISSLESQGVIRESSPWSPWYTSNRVAPAGYTSRYDVPGSQHDLTFTTVRLAGHMVPKFNPEAAFTIIATFLSKDSKADLIMYA